MIENGVGESPSEERVWRPCLNIVLNQNAHKALRFRETLYNLSNLGLTPYCPPAFITPNPMTLPKDS